MPPTMPPPAMPMKPPMPPGNTAPATVAPNSQGLKLRGAVLANAGLTFLTQALPLLGATSPEGQAVSKAITALGRVFAGASGDATRQEGKMMIESAGPVTKPNEQQMGAFQAGIKTPPPIAPPAAAA